MAGLIKVIVVDDHSLFRTGLVQALKLDETIHVVAEGGTAEEAVKLTIEYQPDIVLLDITMPGNGIEAARQLMQLHKPPKVMMLTVSEDDDDIMQALDAGVVGYVLKGVKAPELIEAVRRIAAGDSFVSPNLTLRILANLKEKSKSDLLSSLTKQEEKILRLMALGLSNREIGLKLNVVEQTVKYHVTGILEKLKVRNRVEASVLAERAWGATLHVNLE